MVSVVAGYIDVRLIAHVLSLFDISHPVHLQSVSFLTSGILHTYTICIA